MDAFLPHPAEIGPGLAALPSRRARTSVAPRFSIRVILFPARGGGVCGRGAQRRVRSAKGVQTACAAGKSKKRPRGPVLLLSLSFDSLCMHAGRKSRGAVRGGGTRLRRSTEWRRGTRTEGEKTETETLLSAALLREMAQRAEGDEREYELRPLRLFCRF